MAIIGTVIVIWQLILQLLMAIAVVVGLLFACNTYATAPTAQPMIWRDKEGGIHRDGVGADAANRAIEKRKNS